MRNEYFGFILHMISYYLTVLYSVLTDLMGEPLPDHDHDHQGYTPSFNLFNLILIH